MDIRVAAYGVIINEGKMLLAHWNENGHTGWTLPGGGLEEGEDPADAARREITEETGYTGELDELLGIDSKIVPVGQRVNNEPRPLHALRIIYRARVVGGELTVEVDGTTDGAAWFPLGEVGGLPHVDLVDAGLRFAGMAST